MTAEIIAFPAPRCQLVDRTGYPPWTALREGGVVHRIFCVWTEGRHIYLEAMCGRTGTPQDSKGELCRNCTRRGWNQAQEIQKALAG